MTKKRCKLPRNAKRNYDKLYFLQITACILSNSKAQDMDGKDQGVLLFGFVALYVIP